MRCVLCLTLLTPPPPRDVAVVQVDVIRRRLHKDILHHPVAMLNFCPDLKSVSSDLRKVHGEFIFLVDRSGSMSGANINRVKVPLKCDAESALGTNAFNRM